MLARLRLLLAKVFESREHWVERMMKQSRHFPEG